MNRIEKAIDGINGLSRTQHNGSFMSGLHPFVKIAVTFIYLVTTVSFRPLQFSSLLLMSVYPIFIFISSFLSLKRALSNLRFFLPVILLMALLNPFFDRRQIFECHIYGFDFIVTSGMISSASLVIKGILSVFVSYILISTTTMEEICSCMARLGLPEIMVVQFMLASRYVTVLLEEIKKTNQAYSLRAPGQKGIHFSAWGSLAGGIILRSFDRAQEIYQAMNLRGFSINCFFSAQKVFCLKDLFFLIVWIVIIMILRFFPVYAFLIQIVEKLTGAFA